MRKNTMIGLTHDAQGMPVIREPRVLRVGIGLPKGPQISVYIYRGEWILRFGYFDNTGSKPKFAMKTVLKTKSRAEVEDYYNAHKQEAATSNFPQKIPFFTFTRRTMVETQGKPVEIYTPDFAAIEAHGDTPRELDIVLMSDNPYSGEYQMWSASELKCHGDGQEASRVISLPASDPQSAQNLAAAKAAGLKVYDHLTCATNGCPYYGDDGAKCKPGVTMTFQLANDLRLGASAYFHTTSIRSASQIFSSLETIRQLAGMMGRGLVGLPLKMVLTPFRTNHNNQPATQYGVSLELRAGDMQALRNQITESAWRAPRELPPVSRQDEDAVPLLNAAEIASEFCPEAPEMQDGPEETPEVQQQAAQAQAATEQKTEDLSSKLKAQRENARERKSVAKAEATVAPATEAPAPDPTPATRTRPASAEAPWADGIIDEFWDKLGDKFNEVLQVVCGEPDIHLITQYNYPKVWQAMEKAVSELPAPAAKELF